MKKVLFFVNNDPANWRIYRHTAILSGAEIVVELTLTPEILAVLNL